MTADDRDLLDDQIRYYRARAAEYDETMTKAAALVAALGAV